MKRLLLYSIALSLLTGCSSSLEMARPASEQSIKATQAIQKYHSLAIAKFVSSDPLLGQRIAERLAVRFISRGYSVTGYERLKKLSGKEVLTTPEPTPTDKDVLAHNAIEAVVYGMVGRYECETKSKWAWTGLIPEKELYESCRASLGIKIVDAGNGTIVWNILETHSEETPGMTERMVIERVLRKIEDEIPLSSGK